MEWALAALGSAFGQSFVGLLQKKTLRNVNSSSFAFLFNFFCFIFLIPIAPFVQLNLFFISVLFAKSWLTVFALYFKIWSLRRKDLSEVAPITGSLVPLFVLLLAILFLKECISHAKILGILLVVLGNILLVGKFGKTKIKLEKSLVLLILSSLLYATSAVINKFLLNIGSNIFTVIFFTTLFTTIGLLGLVKMKKRKLEYHLARNLKILSLSGFLTALYRFLAILAVSLGPVSLVSTLRRLYIPITVYLGGKILKEKDILAKFGATIIMLIGVFLIVV